MRAILVGLVLTACGSDLVSPPDDGGLAGRCDGALPGFAVATGGELQARCGGIEVAVRPLAGAVRLRYAEAGAIARRSWAIVDALELASARTGVGDAGDALLCTEELTVRIDEACRVRVELADGTPIVEDAEPFAVSEAARLTRHARADRVYGLGERTGGLDKRGRTWTFWNTDAYDPAHGGWAPLQDPLYQSIPFAVHVQDGIAHGAFVDEPRRMTMDLGATSPTRDTIAAVGARTLDEYVIAGPAMADVVDRYTRLTGRPALPPRWALGFHQSRWGYTNGAELEAIAERFRAEQIPADALWLDIQHMQGFRTFTRDPAFPDATFARLAQLGFRTVAIADPGIKVDPGWPVYDGGLAGDHFVRTAGGEVFEGVAWPGASVFPDFSRPATRAWWGEHVAAMPIDGVWLDVNEPTTFPEGGGGNSVPDDARVFGDGEPTTMATLHNAYALLQSGATYDALAAKSSERPFVLSRAGYAGIQRVAAVWTGDTPSTWDGLAQTLPMLLGLGVSGVPIVGSDIGGYSGHASGELYARWMALGSISAFARAHVTIGVPGQEPWMFGDEVRDISRDVLRERYRLMPYLYSLADEAARTGSPILRPLVWHFPDDPAVADLGDQAMLGPYVLAAPIVTPGATSRSVYLPAGRWFELHSGAIHDGPATIEVSTTLAALPLFVRAGAILPSWPDGPDGALELDVYPSGASSFILFEDAGRARIELAAEVDGARLTIDRDQAPSRELRVRVHRVDGTVTGVDGAQTFHHDTDARALVASVADAAHVALRFRYDPAIVEPRPPVTVTFEVRVPVDTPQSTPISIASSANGWQHAPLAWIAPGLARGTLVVPRGEWLDYKVTRGSWETVEKLASCGETSNRYRLGAAGIRIDTVATWRDRCGN